MITRARAPAVDNAPRRFVVGDIHGCIDELHELIERAELGPEDAIISVGDLLDRGPGSPAVVEFFTTTPRRASVFGNHEWKHTKWLRGRFHPSDTHRRTRAQFATSQAHAVACRRLESLPHIIELPEAYVLHGYLEPDKPLEQQREDVVVGTKVGRALIQARYPHGWYNAYQGAKPVIVGHKNYLQSDSPLVLSGRVVGLDTGCARGGRLTGVLLPEWRIVSVPARRNYLAELKRS